MMYNEYKHNITSNYQMFFHQAGSCQMEGIVSLYNYIMTYLVGILFVVTTALLFIIFSHIHGSRHVKQFKEEKDLEELVTWVRFLQRWTHSTNLELIWTIIPTLILIAIAVPSFILLYSLDEIVDTQCVVKIVAYQWYWKYEYPVIDPNSDDVLTFSYLSYMLPLEDLTDTDNLRLLEVDTPLILPINVNSKLVITSKDVIHSFAVPALGVKMDAVPGRLNQVTVHIFKPGIYYGQCSELCGVNHAFMPIAINAIHFTTFENFLTNCGEKQGIKVIGPFDSFEAAKSTICLYVTFLTTLFEHKDYNLLIRFLFLEHHERDELFARVLLTANKLQLEAAQSPEDQSLIGLGEFLKAQLEVAINCEKYIVYEELTKFPEKYGQLINILQADVEYRSWEEHLTAITKVSSEPSFIDLMFPEFKKFNTNIYTSAMIYEILKDIKFDNMTIELMGEEYMGVSGSTLELYNRIKENYINENFTDAFFADFKASCEEYGLYYEPEMRKSYAQYNQSKHLHALIKLVMGVDIDGELKAGLEQNQSLPVDNPTSTPTPESDDSESNTVSEVSSYSINYFTPNPEDKIKFYKDKEQWQHEHDFGKFMPQWGHPLFRECSILEDKILATDRDKSEELWKEFKKKNCADILCPNDPHFVSNIFMLAAKNEAVRKLAETK